MYLQDPFICMFSQFLLGMVASKYNSGRGGGLDQLLLKVLKVGENLGFSFGVKLESYQQFQYF